MHNRLGHRFGRRIDVPIWIEPKSQNTGMMEENNNPCPPGDHLFAYLQRSSDNSIEMDVNASNANPEIFQYTIPPDKTLELHRLNLYVMDGNVRWNRFGGRNKLQNGLLIQVLDSGANIVQHFGTDVEPILKNADFALLGDAQISRLSGKHLLMLDWELVGPMCLAADWVIRFVLRDNLSGLDNFRVMIQGLLHSNP